MSSELFISEVLCSTIAVISICICYVLYKTRSENSMIKVLFYYFCIEAYIYLWSTLFFFIQGNYFNDLNIMILRVGVLVPKIIIMLNFFSYLNENRNNTYKK